MTDRELLELLGTDKNAGIKRLMDEYTGFVFAVVKARLDGVCGSDEIEDCVSDVFIRFVSGLDTYKGEASLKTYLGVIARNAANNATRDRRDTYSLNDEGFTLDIPNVADVSDEAERRELINEVFSQIKKLGQPDSEILFRKFYLGQSSKTVADEMKLTVSNVDTRAHRALQKLRKRIEGGSI